MNAPIPDLSWTRFDEIGRTPLGSEPTPLVSAPRLAEALGLEPEGLLLKLDAHNGFGLGGNKVRKLEYELAPHRLEGITHLVTSGGVQSNHARVTAAAAARLGLECVLVLNGPEPEVPSGNALLHRLFGARIISVDSRDARDPAMARVAEDIRAEGGHALVIPLGASSPLGALGYVRAAREFVGQLLEADGPPTTIFIASSSCGTVAGLTLGLAMAGRSDIRTVAVSADASEGEILERAAALSAGAAKLAKAPGLTAPLTPEAGFVGPGYGLPSPEGERAQTLFASTAGVVVDPIYTAKAAAGLTAWVASGRIGRDERVVFWHTGGHPAVLS
jgi:1-aminocyclopropane-1-carboxylate deaminase/D-cysteine desulfhydrase-like pyridoxal-dependent ACC family enzyme